MKLKIWNFHGKNTYVFEIELLASPTQQMDILIGLW